MINKINQLKKLIFTGVIIEGLLILAIIILKFSSIDTPWLDNSKFFALLLVAILLMNVLCAILTTGHLERTARRNHLEISNTLGADMAEAFSYGEIGMLIYDTGNEIVWTSDLFKDRDINCIGENLFKTFKETEAFFKPNGDIPESVKVVLKNRIYSVMNLKELNLLVFRDTTETDNLYSMRQKESPVFITITLDNLVDLQAMPDKGDIMRYELEVRQAINSWAKKYNVFIRLFKEDSYMLVAHEEDYAKMVEDKFSLLTTVSNITKDSKIPLTISIGIGRGSDDYAKLAELSSNAIDVALSRGGNQIVISNFGSHMEFLGGTTEVKARKNTIRSRVLSQSLYTHISNNDKVLIVPHDVADFDAIGAALGLRAIALSQNKKVYIVCPLNNMEHKTKAAIKTIFDKKELSSMLIDEEDAIKLCDDKTLICLVDVNRPGMTVCPKLLEEAKKIAVIDHHRRGEDAVDNPIFSLIETSASSASEIIMGLIKYNKNKIELNPKEATALYAGILLDTNNFKINVSTDTFESAMRLKEKGADVDSANEFLKDEFEEYELKVKVMNNAETISFGILLTTAPEEEIVDRTMLAKIAQEALNVKGVKAIFVLGKISEDTIGISARSDGSFNVQYIAEKLGGGGHFAMAAAQIKDKKMKTVCKQVKDLVNVYVTENKKD